MDILTQFITQTIENYNKSSERLNFLDFARGIMELSLNRLMDIQADQYCQELEVERNGYRDFAFNTIVGTLNLKIPKLTRGTYYPDIFTDKYNRSDQCLITVAHELYTSGVSIRKLEKYFESLGITNLKHSAISDLMKKIDREVKEFNSSDLSKCETPYLALDATYMPCRAEGSQALVTAITINAEGYRQFIGAKVVDTESEDSWKGFLESLKARGINGVKLVISDAHGGLKNAIRKTFIGARWQRCIVHLRVNVIEKCNNKKDEKAVSRIMQTIFAEENPEVQRALYHQAIDLISEISKPAANVLIEAEGDALTYLDFPKKHWKKIRTNNIQERANREFKRRFKVVQVFPNKASFERLAGAVAISINERWCLRHCISVESMKLLYADTSENKEPIKLSEVENSAKDKLRILCQELVAENLMAA